MKPNFRSVLLAALASVATYAAAKYGSPATAQLFESRRNPPAPLASASSSPSSSSSNNNGNEASVLQRAGMTTGSGGLFAAVEDDPWTGVLIAQALDLTARIDTKVKTIAFRVGDSVREGDVIGELDTTAHQHELAAAQAAVRASQAEAWNASVSVSQAKDRQNRRSRMFHVGPNDIPLVSQEELSESKFDALSATSRASAAVASADERRAKLAYLSQVIKEATLRAPFDGTVATIYAVTGTTVHQGAPVVRVVGRGALRVRFAVPETDASAVKLQTRVAIEWDDRTLQGTVDRIAPEVESASSSIVMEASVDTALPTIGKDRNALTGRVVGVRLAARPAGPRAL